MYTDIYKLQTADRLFLKPKKIFIHHTSDLLIHQMKGTDRFDNSKAAFPSLAKMCFQDYRFNRFFSHYLIEQIGEDYCIIVGTPENAISPFLNEFFPEISENILILINGDYSFDIPPKEMYIRLGQICSTIMRQYKMSGLDYVELLENVNLKSEFKLTKMTNFNRINLNTYLKF